MWKGKKWLHELRNKNEKSDREAKIMSSSIPAGLSPWSFVILQDLLPHKVGRWEEALLYIQKLQSVRATSREACFFVDSCIGGVFNLSCVTLKEVDHVKCLTVDGSLCIRKWVLILERARKMRMRGYMTENRSEKAEKWRMELFLQIVF